MKERAAPAPSRAARPRLGTRGAVMAEFLIAFMPLFVAFLGLVQLAALLVAKLIVQHAAASAARAAVVVLDDDPEYYNGVERGEYKSERKDDIEAAAQIPLTAVTALVRQVGQPDLQLNGGQAHFGRDNTLIHVKLAVTYHCMLPLGAWICMGDRTLTGEAALPNNGARYEY